MSQKNYISKVVSDAHAALDGLEDNMTVMFGGFGLCGIPENSIAAIRDKGTTGITCISNNAGVDDFGLGLLLKTRQIVKMIASYVGETMSSSARCYLESLRWTSFRRALLQSAAAPQARAYQPSYPCRIWDRSSRRQGGTRI